jgi:hypothetical protein
VCEGRTQGEGAQVLRLEQEEGAPKREGVHLFKGFTKYHKASSREAHSTSGQRQGQLKAKAKGKGKRLEA